MNSLKVVNQHRRFPVEVEDEAHSSNYATTSCASRTRDGFQLTTMLCRHRHGFPGRERLW